MNNPLFRIAFFAMVLIPSSLLGETRYVSVTGSDQNPGSFEKPFASIQHGTNQTFAGDTLIIRGGAYYLEDNIKITHTGKHGAWVTLMAQPGEEVTINANRFLAEMPENTHGYSWMAQGSIHIEGVSYVRIQGLRILYSHMAGIMVRGKGQSNFEIKDCYIFSSYNSGIGLWYADSVRVTGCEVIDANNQDHAPAGMRRRREAPHEAISVAGTTNFEIDHNHLHICSKEGIDVKEFSANGRVHHNYVHNILRQGIYIDSWFGLLHNVEVYNNIVHDCEWGIMVNSEGENSRMQNVRIHNNLVYNNRATGISIMTMGHNEPRKDIEISNNTVCFNGMPGHWSGKTGGLTIMSSNLSKIRIHHNIFYNNYGFEMATFDDPGDGLSLLKAKEILITNNLSSDLHDVNEPPGIYDIQVYATQGEETLYKDPRFTDPRGLDFTLTLESPARDPLNPEKVLYGADLNQFVYITSILKGKRR